VSESFSAHGGGSPCPVTALNCDFGFTNADLLRSLTLSESCQKAEASTLFDHLIGNRKHARRDRKAERTLLF
jgi:hypothetical protein